MRVLVSGGAGFIGSHVVDALLSRGHEVAALDDLSSGHRRNVPASVRLYELDLRDREATRRAVLDFRPQAVSHHAAQVSVPSSVREPHVDAEVNVLGGLSLLDACTQPGLEVERVVFASTGGAIYGEVAEGTRATELTRPNPVSPYAIHKLTFEQLLAVYETHRGLRFTALRYANVYGPRQDPFGEAGVVAIYFGRAREGRALSVNARRELGDAGCVRDYIFVHDVARANALALAGAIPEKILNLGTGSATSTRELAELVLMVSGRESRLEFGPPRSGDVQRSVLDPTLAEARLGPLTPLLAGLELTASTMKSAD
jgi:UDP-glucose 4-epimerase